MKPLFKYIVLVTFLGMLVFTAHAQADKASIQGAARTARDANASDAKKLPPDTLKWKKGGDVSLNFAQTALSNWAAGGENSLAISTTANLFANYKKNKMIWENRAFFAYGMLQAGGRDAVKNSDQINVGSKVGYQMAKNWYYTAAFHGRSQFAPGYRYSGNDTTYISNFLAPAYTFLSLGLDYRPSSRFSASFSPAMGKAIFVRSDDPNVLATSGIGADRIEKDKRSRYEFGGGMVFYLNGDFFSKRVTYNTDLELFSNYLEDPENVDIYWNFQFRIALTKFVAATVRLNMIYDDNQKTVVKELQADGSRKDVTHGAKLQVKEYFEIGLFYAF